MATARSSIPERRTQAERREETRERLLRAAIGCLREEGYAGLTTREVARRAGVSQGAQAYHFPSRADMVVGVVEWLGTRWVAQFEAIPASLGEAGGPAGTEVLLDLLWDLCSSPDAGMLIEIWVASAQDAELRRRLAAAEEEAFEVGLRTVRATMGDALPVDIERRLRIVVASMRGLAIALRYDPTEALQAEDAWADQRAILLQLLEG
jgi:AcrR family transcriptional regulator